MARTFVAASSQRLSANSASITAVPLTLAAWFNPTTAAVEQSILSLSNDGSDNSFEILRSSASFIAASSAGGSFAPASVGSVVVENQWQHGCGVFSATNARKAYWNGTSTATSATSSTPAGINHTSIGAIDIGSITRFWGGSIAEAGVWNVALTDEEVQALAKGICPLFIRPQSLIHYWPLYGNDAPELDRAKTNTSLTLSNTPTKGTTHPRIYYPAPVMSTATGAATFTLDAETGIYTLTGSDAEFIRALQLRAAAGSYQLTGSEADLEYILATRGSRALRGTNVTSKIIRATRDDGETN